MRLKFTIFLLLIFCGSISLNSADKHDSTQKVNAVINKIRNMSSEDFINYYKKAQPRVPENVLKFYTDSNRTKPAESIKDIEEQGLNIHQSLPPNMIFPGEYEEMKAILIAWPYITVDSSGYFVFQTFKNVIIGSRPYGSDVYESVPVRSYIDSFPQSPIAKTFANVIHAIDDNAEVWINVWEEADTAVVKRYMEERNMPLKNAKFFVNVGNTYWLRDSGPVAFYYGKDDSLAFMDFEYYEGRPLDDSISFHIGNKLGIPVFANSINCEGGNILQDGIGSLFCSDVVYHANTTDCGQLTIDKYGVIRATYKKPLNSAQVRDSLFRLLNLNTLRVLPYLHYDGGTGHIDMYVDMPDENRFVVVKYPEELRAHDDYKITQENSDSLIATHRADGEHYTRSNILLPRKDDGNYYNIKTYEYNRYLRSYANHLFVNKAILQPVFANDTAGDRVHYQKDLDSIKAQYPGYNVIPIDMRAFDGFGGSIHCITKQIPADNPLRIIHYPIKSSNPTQQLYKINATITNRSGIKSASVKWRYAGESNWQDAPLSNITGDITKFAADIKNVLSHGKIEYYITATSNNGKTMTKPITAPDGFYQFRFDKHSDVSEKNFNPDYSCYFEPNPFKLETSLKISTQKEIDNLKLEIYDLLGNTRKTITGISSGEIKIDGRGLEAGMYFYRISNQEGIIAAGKLMVSYN